MERAQFIRLVIGKSHFTNHEQPKRYNLWLCQKVCDALHYLLDDIFIRFGLKLYEKNVSISMCTNNWASPRENLSSGVCEQHRCRPACASAQFDQRLRIRFLESITPKLATSEISS